MTVQTFTPPRSEGLGTGVASTLIDAWRAADPQQAMSASTRLGRDAADAAARLMASVQPSADHR